MKKFERHGVEYRTVSRATALRYGPHDGCPFCRDAYEFIKKHKGAYRVIMAPKAMGNDIVGLWFT